MPKIGRILCPVDFSEHSRHALDYAVALARWYRALISTMYVHRLVMPTLALGPYVAPESLSPIGLTDAERSHLMQALGDFVAKDRESGASIEVALEESLNIADGIVAKAQTLDADLIVMGTHGRSGFDRWVLGSVAERVLRLAASPVLIVPARAPDAVPFGKAGIERIVCPIDFSTSSKRALEYAASLAGEAKARLTVLNVIELLPDMDGVAELDFASYRAARFDEAGRSMAQALSPDVSRGCAVDDLLLTGKPYREILRLAKEQQAGLIVMGVRGRGALDRMFFGSTTQHVVRQATCPVLTVRAD